MVPAGITKIKNILPSAMDSAVSGLLGQLASVCALQEGSAPCVRCSPHASGLIPSGHGLVPVASGSMVD